MGLMHRVVLFVTICFAVSMSNEFAELGDDVLAYFRDSPISGVTNILQFRSDIRNRDAVTPRRGVEIQEPIESIDVPKKKQRRKKYQPKSPVRPVPQGSLLEYKLDNLFKRSDDNKDVRVAAGKARILKNAKAKEQLLNTGRLDLTPGDGATDTAKFHMDPVFNMLRSGQHSKDFRRNSGDGDADDSSSSESGDNLNWKEEWQRLWRYKKYEALNASRPRGDQVAMVAARQPQRSGFKKDWQQLWRYKKHEANTSRPRGSDQVAMVAARPWGVPCGDPNQHDKPWGNCMLAAECEVEFRIYKGDFFCGRTQFVCCGFQVTNYDLYQGFDVSFGDKSLSTDSNEKREAGGTDKEKKKEKDKKKRKQNREKRKRKIKNTIKKVVNEIRKILNKAYKNGTKERKKETKVLKKFVKHLKRQYKKDRQSIMEIHQEIVMKVDAALMTKLDQIRLVNEHFMQNKTFRDIVINGTITETGARMLVEAYPDLASSFTRRRSGTNLLRNKRGKHKSVEEHPKKDYLDYDIEYGFLYY